MPGGGDGGAGVGVAPGRVAPGDGAVVAVEAVDAGVVVAGVDPAEGDRRGRVEGPGGAESGPEGAALPFELPGTGVDGVHVAAVVADVEGPVLVGGGRLDRSAERGRPADVAADRAEREQFAVFAAEVDGAADDDRRGLGPARQRPFPDRLPGAGVELDDVAGVQVDDVEPVFGVGGRGGVEVPDPPFPEELPGVGVEGAGPAAVVDEVEAAGDVDRRELEQRPAGVAPEFAERRLDALGGQVPGARPVEPEERPVDRFRLRLRRLLRLERDVGVVDVGGALEQLVGEQRAAGHQQHRGDDRGDRLPPVVLPGPTQPGAGAFPGPLHAAQADAAARRSDSEATPLRSCLTPWRTPATTARPTTGMVGFIRTT